MKYTVNCTIKDKQGREVRYSGPSPLWSGAAFDAKCAIEFAHEVLGPTIKAETRADTIVLFIRDEAGNLTTATEYAEDFTIGYGASAVGGSGLLADKIDLGLTEAQKAEAMRALKTRAIAAMPGIKEYATGGLVPRIDVEEPGLVTVPILFDGFVDAIKSTEKDLNDFADVIKGLDERAKMWDAMNKSAGEQARTVSWLIRDHILNAEYANQKINAIQLSPKAYYELADEMGKQVIGREIRYYMGIPLYYTPSLPRGDVRFLTGAK